MKRILSAKEVRDYIENNIKEELSKISEPLKLVVVRVGNNEASKIYVNSKRKACERNGILFEEKHFDDISEEKLINNIEQLNNDSSVTSILVQLPLPEGIDESKIINSINPLKDVDGLTNVNMGKLINNAPCIKPCTAKGIISLLDYYNISISGKRVVLIGRSRLIGRPLIPLFLKRDATVTVCHSKTKNINDIIKQGEIIVVAVGIPGFLKENMVNEDATIIDVGITKVDDKIYGDACFDEMINKCDISPVPGGVGIMTVVSVIENIIDCYKLQK